MRLVKLMMLAGVAILAVSVTYSTRSKQQRHDFLIIDI